MIVMPLTYSITDGIAAGFISYVVPQDGPAVGLARPSVMWLTALAFVLYLAVPWLQQTFGI